MEYGIDWLLARSNLIYGHGWLSTLDQTIERVFLDLDLSNGATASLPVARVKYRDVVAPSLRTERLAARSGFIVYGATDSTAPIVSATLRVELQDGTTERLAAPLEDLSQPKDSILRLGTAIRFSQLRKAWTLARKLKLRQLLLRLYYWRARSSPLPYRDPRPQLMAACQLSDQSGAVVIIDHSLTGGANDYRHKLLERRIGAGEVVALVTFHLSTLQYGIKISYGKQFGRETALKSLEFLTQIAEDSLVKEVFCNNLVSFPNPEEIPGLLAQLANVHDIPLTVAIHDFFPLCPSHFLLNWEGVYCDLPETSVCQDCLPKNEFSLFQVASKIDVPRWRGQWALALSAAKTVLCFSAPSSRMLRRIFPDLSNSQIRIQPHDVDDLPDEAPAIDPSLPLCIGIVGTITLPKGANVVAMLANRIQARNLDVKIAVIGTLDVPMDPRIVSVSGAYEKSALPKLIERSGANVMLFPSIWPETFSYVTAELMAMRVPVACFGLGAPAERISAYPLGKVIHLTDPDSILDQLMEFHHELKEANDREAHSA